MVENSHASTSLSWAHGIARGHALQGQTDRYVVAVVGDGALTGGMAWEALNNIAADADGRLVVVVNDNGRSYAPTIGGMAHHLATLRTTRGYERFLDWGKATLTRGGAPGRMAYDTLHGMKKGLKDFVAPQGLFEDLGLKYVGPVDGHDVEALEHALRRARAYGGPVIVHAMTRKGNGFSAAEAHEDDRFHAVAAGVIDPDTGQSLAAPSAGPTWTKVFAEEMVEVGRRRPDVVGLTAAMLIPVGLHRFASEHPDRVIDVGIAEQHATTAAAGLAFTGLHPVVAVYSTFLNRAFDQVLLDVALHRAGVTFVLDRAGITGPDGPSHYGIWDMSLLAPVPGLRLAAPRDAETLREELGEAVEVSDGPTVLRFATGVAPERIPALERLGGRGGVDVLARTGDEVPRDALPGEDPAAEPAGGSRDVLLVAVGAFAPLALDAAQRLAAHGISSTVVDPRWVLPVPAAVVDLAREHRLVVTVEDGVRTGGVGSCAREALADAGVDVPVTVVGVPARFWEHGTRAQVLADAGLTAQDVARTVAERVAGLPDRAGAPERAVQPPRPGEPVADRT